MRTPSLSKTPWISFNIVGMKPLSERDENNLFKKLISTYSMSVGMKPLSERDENPKLVYPI